jgi:hypothetical protein
MGPPGKMPDGASRKVALHVSVTGGFPFFLISNFPFLISNSLPYAVQRHYAADRGEDHER